MKMTPKKGIEISFCIRVYNEEKFLKSKLENLIPKLKTAKVNSEIVIVLQGDDKSYEIASSFKKRFDNLRIYKLAKPSYVDSTNEIVRRASSDIIVMDDADNLFMGDIDRIVKIFNDKKTGGIVQFDVATREWFNKGHKLFDKCYDEVKLNHHMKGNVVTDPIFSVHIFRKSALNMPYITTFNDDTEITHNLISNGYNVIYDKELAYCVMNSPLQIKITIAGIFKRRLRAEKFRKQAKEMLNTSSFSIKSRVVEFVEAILLTVRRANFMEMIGFIEYLIVILLATIIGKIRLLIKDDNKFVRIR